MRGIIIANSKINEIRKYAMEEYPNECCGVMLGKENARYRHILQIVPTSNCAKEKENCFRISPLDIFKIEQSMKEKEMEILGIYHSHPECQAILSGEDIKQMIPGLSYLIVTACMFETEERNCEIRSYCNHGKERIEEEHIICG